MTGSPGAAPAVLRVLLVGQDPATPGGMASVQRLHAAALARRGDVAVTLAVTYAETGAAGRARHAVRGLARALALVLTRRVDVVDLHVSKGLSVLRKGVVVTAARLRGVPTVLHTHAGAFADWFDALPRPARALLAALVRPDRVVVLTPAARAVYAERLRLPADRVVAAANPVEWPATLPPRPARAAGDPVEAVFLGRLIDRKGVFDLLEALAAVRARAPAGGRALHLTLAGHGDLPAVRARVAALGLSDAVDLRSWLGPDERDALLARAQLLVLPSWWEALPMAVLEAMAWGVAPVVTPVGGLVDLVDDGRTGVLVPLRDPAALAAALTALVADDDRRAALGAAAREAVRGYSADAWADRLTGLYRDLACSPRATAGPGPQDDPYTSRW